MIIGLSGYARSGKDTAAEGLQAIGFERVAFADKLREFLYALDPIIAEELVPESLDLLTGYDHIYKRIRLQQIIDKYGWNGYKETRYGQEIRALLQRLGTECGRSIISDTIWIDAALNNASAENIVVTDCRFENKASAIKDRGGFVVRINRPGITAVNAHISETSLDNWLFDHVIENDGFIDKLHADIRNAVRELARRAKIIEDISGGSQ